MYLYYTYEYIAILLFEKAVHDFLNFVCPAKFTAFLEWNMQESVVRVLRTMLNVYISHINGPPRQLHARLECAKTFTQSVIKYFLRNMFCGCKIVPHLLTQNHTTTVLAHTNVCVRVLASYFGAAQVQLYAM